VLIWKHKRKHKHALNIKNLEKRRQERKAKSRKEKHGISMNNYEQHGKNKETHGQNKDNT
jgi:hypothetical protein